LSQVAELVTSEFFEQGDIERHELHITPIVSRIAENRKGFVYNYSKILFLDCILILLKIISGHYEP